MTHKKYNQIYLMHFLILIFIIIFGLCSSPLNETFEGIKKILLHRSLLLTDYIVVGGLGAALVNCSLTSLSILLLLKINKIKPNGSMILSIWLILGFSMMGKNFLNIWPTIIGVYIYSRLQKKAFSNYIFIAILSTALSPLSEEIFRILPLNNYISIILSILFSILIGVILPPIAKFTFRIHQGYNLYNVGFANGIITIIIMSILKYFNVEIKTSFIWGKEFKIQLIIFLSTLFITLIVIGLNKYSIHKFAKILRHSGRTLTDYYLIYDKNTFLNMGILGIFSLSYVLMVGGDLNGPTTALILCITAFGSFGKHLLNITPIMLGVIICASFKGTPLNTPVVLLTTLNSTALAPIAGQYGLIPGIIAGIIHFLLLLNIGNLSHGINLYNSGFIAGIVSIILLPILDSVKKGD